MNQLKR